MRLTRLTVRLFLNGEMDRELPDVTYGSSELGELLQRWATEYGHKLHMIEFEFLDAPEGERFLRIGNDPHYMVDPCGVDIEIS